MIEKRKTKGTPDTVDKHVGRQLRNRRTLVGMSQEKLAEQVGVTFQQIQKYERGTNRISASRLFAFSRTLGVPIDYFYEGLEGAPCAIPANQNITQETIINDKHVLRVVQTLSKIEDPKIKKDICSFVTNMSKGVA